MNNFVNVDPNTVGAFDDRELGWDDTIERDSADFITVPAGDYDFEVIEFERGRHNGSEKLPPCNKAVVHIKITTPQGVTVIKHNLFLHTKTEGMLCEFFASIGQRKKGEKLKMNWNMVPGSHGRAKVGIRTYNGNEYNEIKKFYPAEDVPASPVNTAAPASAQVSFEQGRF